MIRSQSFRHTMLISAGVARRISMALLVTGATLALHACGGGTTDTGTTVTPPLAVVSQVVVTSSTATPRTVADTPTVSGRKNVCGRSGTLCHNCVELKCERHRNGK